MEGKNFSLEKRITDASPYFTSSQKIIARYFLANETSVFFKTAAAIASEIGVSESTIVRFAKAIGFESYTQMQACFKQQYVNNTSFLERLKKVHITGENHEFYETLFQNDANAILNMIQPAFFDVLDQAAGFIEYANRIYITGSRGSASVATHIAFNLNYMKPDVVSLVSDFGEWQDRMLDCKEKDLIIGVCMPNYTQRTLDMMAFAKNRNASVLTITDSALSPACSISDVSVCCGNQFVWSPSTTITVANALLQKVAQSGNPAIIERMNHMNQALNNKSPYAKY